MAKKAPTVTIQDQVFIPAAPDAIYSALLNPKQHAAFTGAAVTGKAKVGAEFTAWDGYITGRHLQLEKGRLIVQEWSTSEWPAGYEPSILVWTFKPKRNGTEVTLLHTQVPAEQAADYADGWREHYFTPMTGYFSTR